jgi:hypothetical protein
MLKYRASFPPWPTVNASRKCDQPVVLAFFALVTGAGRFALFDGLREDRVLHGVLGLARFPGDDLVRAFSVASSIARSRRFGDCSGLGY